MSEQILASLKRKLDDAVLYGDIDVETRRNVLKEELQFYVLNFIYHHPEYSKWRMYGGSALRIIHGLDRMSVDLDFEVSHAINEKFLQELKKEVEDYFVHTYATGADFLAVKITTGRGLLLKFHVGDELSFGHPSKQVHIKIDLNYFTVEKTVMERRPINHGQLSFVIVTYNMSALMASKIAAIFLRGVRGVGKSVYEEKGRDIYDLLWYMNKNVVPDLDYLQAKAVQEAKDVSSLFDKLTIKISKVNDANLKQDLSPLFTDRTYIEHWLANWRESYLRLLDAYEINTITTLKNVQILLHQHVLCDNFSFTYVYDTEEGRTVRIRYIISEEWFDFRDGDLSIETDKKLEDKIEFPGDRWSSKSVFQGKLKQYATLFNKKTEAYFEKTNRIMLGDSIITKVVRMTSDNLNQKEQIVLNRSALLSSELDDLLQ